jgi:hypothetical protein
MGIPIGRPRRQFYRLHSTGGQRSQQLSGEQRVAVVNQASVSRQESVPIIAEVARHLTARTVLKDGDEGKGGIPDRTRHAGAALVAVRGSGHRLAPAAAKWPENSRYLATGSFGRERVRHGAAGPGGPDCPSFFWSGHGSTRSMIRDATHTLAAVFAESGVPNAGAHRFRHTLATEVLGLGGTFEDAADILGNSPAIVRKHYAKWSAGRQARISGLLVRLWHRGKSKPQAVDSEWGNLVDGAGLEPATPALRTPCSPN